MSPKTKSCMIIKGAVIFVKYGYLFQVPLMQIPKQMGKKANRASYVKLPTKNNKRGILWRKRRIMSYT